MIFFERGFAHEAAAFHRIVLLRDAKRIGSVDFLDFDASDEAGRGRGAKLVGVEPGALGDPERRRDLILSCASSVRRGAVRPQPRAMVRVWSACPGATRTGNSMLRPSGVVTLSIGKAVVGSMATGESEVRGETKSVSGKSCVLLFRWRETLTPSFLAIFGLT